MAEHTQTDCRTDTGVTVSLIDGIINSARLLANRAVDDPAIAAALADLRADEDVSRLLGLPDSETETVADAPKGDVAGFLSVIGLDRPAAYRIAAWLLGGYHVTPRKPAPAVPEPTEATNG